MHTSTMYHIQYNAAVQCITLTSHYTTKLAVKKEYKLTQGTYIKLHYITSRDITYMHTHFIILERVVTFNSITLHHISVSSTYSAYIPSHQNCITSHHATLHYIICRDDSFNNGWLPPTHRSLSKFSGSGGWWSNWLTGTQKFILLRHHALSTMANIDHGSYGSSEVSQVQ